LNILAGVPFAIFDLLIITLLLPKAIQWWDEKHWQGTRLRAANHLLRRYHDVDEELRRFIQAELNLGGDSKFAFNIVTQDLILKTMRDHADAMDSELQTALPVLGPEMSQDMLALHYDWKKFVRRFKDDGWLSTSEFQTEDAIHTAFRSLLYDATDIGIRHQALTVKYAADDLDITLRQSSPYLPFASFHRVYAPVLRRVAELKTGKPETDYWELASDVAKRQRLNLMTEPKVRPFIRRTFWHWLRQRQLEPLMTFEPGDYTEAKHDWLEVLKRTRVPGPEMVSINLTTGERTVIDLP
jgi:hypothetical protein